MLLSQPQVTLHWLRVGHCRQLEALARRGGAWRIVDFPSYAGLVRHPDAGWLLFDTGYSERNLSATRPFPERLYRWATPLRIPEREHLVRQLPDLDVEADAIGTVVVSHFHGDHVGALRDLPAARIVAGGAGFAQISTTGRWRGGRHGLLPALLPEDAGARFSAVEDLPAVGVGPFVGRDLLGDRSVVAVELPGHLPGHLGLLVTTAHGQLLLVGDAAWSSRAIREDTPPARVVARGLHDPAALVSTLHQLHVLAAAHPDVRMLPSHCEEAAEGWRRASG